jgi:small subunit ribosomal protein S4
MGKPKFSRKKYETPSHPWQEDRIKAEDELIRKYGLKNKREIWKTETALRKYRGQARELLAKVRGGDPQIKKESDQLLMHLNRLNILPPNSTLDDVLALETESILSRRLQTLTYLKGLANTPMHARQLISHGHIAIAERKTTVPGYMVTKEEESTIGYFADSPLNELIHPSRPRADFKTAPLKKEVEPEKPKEERAEGKKEVAPDEKPKDKVEEEKKDEPSEEKPSEKPKPEEKKETPSEEKDSVESPAKEVTIKSEKKAEDSDEKKEEKVEKTEEKEKPDDKKGDK